MPYTSIFWILVLVAILIYIPIRRQKKFNALPEWEKLWVTFADQPKGSPSWEVAKNKLAQFVIAEMRTARNLRDLMNTNCKYSSYIYKKKEHKLDSENVVNFFQNARTEFIAMSDKSAQTALTSEQARQAYYAAFRGSSAEKLSFEKWNDFSLKEVLSAETLPALRQASSRAHSESLARKFVPFMHEYISMRGLEKATGIDELVAVAEQAPPEGHAFQLAFRQIHRHFLENP